MLLDLNLDQALDLLAPTTVAARYTIVPADTPDCPHAPYRAGYEWLFVWERRLAADLEPWLGRLRHRLIGEHGILCEALSNAFLHGHGKDPRRPIEVAVYRGKDGVLIRIKDDGKGFFFRKVVEDFARRRTYYHAAGNGLRAMAQSQDFGVFFNPMGTAVHLLHLPRQQLAHLARRHGLLESSQTTADGNKRHFSC